MTVRDTDTNGLELGGRGWRYGKWGVVGWGGGGGGGGGGYPKGQNCMAKSGFGCRKVLVDTLSGREVFFFSIGTSSHWLRAMTIESSLMIGYQESAGRKFPSVGNNFYHYCGWKGFEVLMI